MKRIIGMFLGLALLGSFSAAEAEIVQGQLELRWGDPIPAPGKSKPGRFVATLVTDGGARHALDAAQARRAAVDLYALANRRVAVEFSGSKRGGTRSIDAIVPADRPRLPASSKALIAPKAVLGNTRWVTIACKFSDVVEEQQPLSFFQGQYGTDVGHLGHYWPDVSYGKINLTGSNAYGWFTLPHPRSHYVPTVDGEEDADLDLLFEDCAAAADPTVDFNGVQGINMMFNGDLDGYAWGGRTCGPLEGAEECIRNTWNPPWAFENLAPLAHEMGHAYGLPHSDNSDGDDDTYDNPWDVMSDAWSNSSLSPFNYGRLPKHINIRQRDRLGWVDAARKLTIPVGGAAKNVTLDRASLTGSTNRQMIVLPLAAPDAKGNVAYTVEARSAFNYYEMALAGKAVIIHGIDARGVAYSMDADVPPANTSNNEGSMFKAGETWVSPDGSQRVKVESVTPDGFIVTIGRPRETGGNQRPRAKPSAVSATQKPQAGQPPRRIGSDCADSTSARCRRPAPQVRER